MLQTGTLIDGRYRILRKIGTGGTGIVYLVLNERAGCLRAMKVLHSDACADPEAELQILRSLHHPMLPEIVDVVSLDEGYCLIMQYMEGETLEQTVRRRRVSTREVLFWGVSLCSLLQYLHGRPVPVFYYDLKPANIILGKHGALSLVDFGSARIRQGSKEGTILTGTPGFAAPERCIGEEGDGRSDIYSLGAVLFYLLCGQKPRPGLTRGECLGQLIRAGREGMAAKSAAGILADCLQPDPALRPQDAGELGRRFHRAGGLWSLQILKQRAAGMLVFFLAGLSLFCLAAAPICYYASAGMRARVYAQDLERAASAGEEDRVLLLKEAVTLYPERGEPYLALLEAMTEDGLFSAQESALMTQILYGHSMARMRENLEYFKEDTNAFYYFSYRMGLAYYFLAGEKGDKSAAAAWFSQVLEQDPAVEPLQEADQPDPEKIRNEAAILLDMCAYYKGQIAMMAGQGQPPENLWERMERLLQAGMEQEEEAHRAWILGEWLHMFYDNMDYLRTLAGEEAAGADLQKAGRYLAAAGSVLDARGADLGGFYHYVLEDWHILCADTQAEEGD